MTTTLVTGGLGMLGSAIVRRLIKEGDRVVVVARSPNLFFLTGRGVDVASIDLVIGDIADPALMGSTLDSYQVARVVHVAAAVSSACNRDPVSATSTNCMATVQLLENCQVRDIRRVVMCSSVSVYAPQAAYRPEELPLTEKALLAFAPGSPLYGAGKLYLEAAAHWYRQAHGMEIAGLRASFIASAGKDERPPLGTLGGRFIDAVGCRRATHVEGLAGLLPFVYVEDVVEQFLTLLTAPDDKLAAGPFFNTGSTVYTIGQVVQTLRRLVPGAEISIGDSTRSDLTFGMPSDISDRLFAGTFGVSRRYDLERSVRAQLDEARGWPGLFTSAR